MQHISSESRSGLDKVTMAKGKEIIKNDSDTFVLKWCINNI